MLLYVDGMFYLIHQHRIAQLRLLIHLKVDVITLYVFVRIVRNHSNENRLVLAQTQQLVTHDEI